MPNTIIGFGVITLTEFGDKLDCTDSQMEDDTKMEHALGLHKECCEWLELNSISEMYNAICCKNCNLRVPIPRSIQTFGELKEYMHLVLEKAE